MDVRVEIFLNIAILIASIFAFDHFNFQNLILEETISLLNQSLSAKTKRLL